MISPISYAQVLAEPELLKAYSDECSIAELGETNPCAAMYRAMESADILKIFGAFVFEGKGKCGDPTCPCQDGDMCNYEGDNPFPPYRGKLIGFASLLVTVYPHYTRKVATLESLYVLPEYRSTGAGTELMQTVERYAKKDGCAGIMYSAPAGGRLAALLKKKGYRQTSAVYVRSID